MKLFKKAAALATALCMSLSGVGVLGVEALADTGSTFTSIGGWYETAYATWSDSNATSAEVYYKAKGAADSEYVRLNSSTDAVNTSLSVYDGSSYDTAAGYKKCVVRQTDSGTARVDIMGIGWGSFDIKVVASDGTTTYEDTVDILQEDRSGYAHFNRPTASSDDDNSYDGVGAYTDSGTPKDNADIIYVTEDNKNTVSYGGYTGIGNITSKVKSLYSKNGKPIIIRFLGEIDTTTWSLSGSTITENSDATPLDGLLNRFYIYNNSYTFNSSSGNYETNTSNSTTDTYIGMMDFKGSSGDGYTAFSNITLEGVGTDAEFVNWGVSFRYANSIEVKNIIFTHYQEDGCSAQDSNRVWFHRCTFNVGKND